MHYNDNQNNNSFVGVYFKESDLSTIKCGNSGIELIPINADIASSDSVANMFHLFGNTEVIKKYLPSMDFSSQLKTQEFLMKSYLGTKMGGKITYFITSGGMPLGMIFLTTPGVNKLLINYCHWTMDFFLFTEFEGKGIMGISLARMLKFMKEQLEIDEVHFMVDADNQRCISLLENMGVMDELDNAGWNNTDGGSVPRVFVCPLKDISFQKAR